MTLSIIKRALGFSGGLCDRVRSAAVELRMVAKDLQTSVAIHQRAPDPFGSVLSTMWNNHKFETFNGGGVDTGKSRVYRRGPSNGRASLGN